MYATGTRLHYRQPMLLSTKMYRPHNKDECSKMRSMDIYLEEPQEWLREVLSIIWFLGKFGFDPSNFGLVIS